MDQGYIDGAGAALATLLYYRSRSCEVAYTPGNGTLYELVFVPFGLSPVISSLRDYMDHDAARSVKQDRPELEVGETRFLLAWVGHGAYFFDLARVPTGGWVAEKLGGSLGDGDAIRALLASASRHAHFTTLAAVS